MRKNCRRSDGAAAILSLPSNPEGNTSATLTERNGNATTLDPELEFNRRTVNKSENRGHNVDDMVATNQGPIVSNNQPGNESNKQDHALSGWNLSPANSIWTGDSATTRESNSTTHAVISDDTRRGSLNDEIELDSDPESQHVKAMRKKISLLEKTFHKLEKPFDGKDAEMTTRNSKRCA